MMYPQVYWYTLKNKENKSYDDCPLCAAGHVPTKKYIYQALIIKKSYKKIIKQNRSIRRSL